MKRITKIVGFMLVIGISLICMKVDASAHGYISKPASRAYLGNLGINKNVGSVQWEPQSIEAAKGFPAAGPVDGKIAGGGKYPLLDVQTENRWVKVDMQPGLNTFEWTLTAPHRTASWQYYITKKDWDPNAPLTRASLEPLKTIQDNGSIPSTKVVQQVEIPADRSGYYVILGIWNIADTGNAFYQVIDANIVNGDGEQADETDTEVPTAPSELASTVQTFHSIQLSWKKAIDNKGIAAYEIYRDGKKVGESTTTTFTDEQLAADTAYTYQVYARDFAGNRSVASEVLVAQTKVKPAIDNVAPTAPTRLMAHAKTTSTVDFCWQRATDNVKVDHYEIYRNGIKIASTTSNMYQDKGLKADTSYTYQVFAVDTSGNRSAGSNQMTVKTEPKLEGVWTADEIYLSGDTVTFNGKSYRAKWWTRGNNPETSDVWQLISNDIPEWNSLKAYSGGDKVRYNGKLYQAKWWNKNARPAGAAEWKEIQE
ncbi:lytic polysaccharide monooxygenase [Listeria ilorinensis]|uniref:lytic polysaccharide monooxygenase n=1 Tax=Listeria ilorinensis TaxID=2867439 RepID=UPI001EF491E7|nr:lytic polysaccharide monooxygenase [Listeria ilorinensis]